MLIEIRAWLVGYMREYYITLNLQPSRSVIITTNRLLWRRRSLYGRNLTVGLSI